MRCGGAETDTQNSTAMDSTTYTDLSIYQTSLVCFNMECEQELQYLEESYMNMYSIMQDYQKAFAWLEKQEWYQNNQHKLHEFFRQEELNRFVDASPSAEQFNKPVTVTCTVCEEETVERRKHAEKAVCIKCKLKRKREYTRKLRVQNHD